MNFESMGKSGAVEGFCLIKTCDKKTTAKGLPYLDMILSDASGEIVAKLWDYNEEAHGSYEANNIVKVRGTISPYNGADQLRVERIRLAIPSDNINIEDFVQSADYSGEMMYSELEAIVTGFSDADFKSIVLKLLKENKEKLLYWPAAFKLHHAIRGGLLYHTLSIVRLAQGVCKIYPSVNPDLLLAGAILHDIGKLDEFEVSDTGLASGYTVDGNLIGHLVRGAIAIEKAGEELRITPDKYRLLQHMLISHHGEPEFGAAVRPMFLEAEILSTLDLLDSRIFEIENSVSAIAPGEYSQRQWALDNRKFFNHGLSAVDTKANLK
ncbi:MAG: HD domain-containing protein [Clostridia bacterium]|nr:HD domain-containing protein [Clostridia bacterium]